MSEVQYKTILSKDTLIPVGSVITVLLAAFGYGILSNQVTTLKEEVTGLRSDVKELSENVNRLVGKYGSVSFKEPTE